MYKTKYIIIAYDVFKQNAQLQVLFCDSFLRICVIKILQISISNLGFERLETGFLYVALFSKNPD